MRKRSLVSLAAFVVLFTVLFFNTPPVTGQSIRGPEKIIIDTEVNLQEPPKSLCITEDQIVFLPNIQTGSMDIFNKEGNFLKFTKNFGFNSGTHGFMEPWYCFYSQKEAKLGVIDYKRKKVFIFDRKGKVDLSLITALDCKAFAYDMDFTGDGKSVVVSGYITDDEGNPYDLYKKNIKTGEKVYLLPSYEKYNLSNPEEYFEEYRQKQTIPAIGIKGFFDIQGDILFYVWEGLPRIIKIDLKSNSIIGESEKSDFSGQKAPHFTKPDASDLALYYKSGKSNEAWKKREKRAYVRNIFATPNFVFLIYETAKKNGNTTFWLQRYTPEGELMNEIQIPGNPGKQMWLDKENYELYAFASNKKSDADLTILKYTIER